MKTNILIIEDEKDISDGLSLFLRHNGFNVCQSFNGNDAKKIFKEFAPNIVLLDTLLPDIRGNILCEEFKSKSDVGIIFLTALSDKENMIKGFHSGADDYISKPFDLDILLLRIQALLSRMEIPQTNSKHNTVELIKSVKFDMYKNDIMHNKKFANLTPTEFKILHHLASKTNYCSTQELLSHIYDIDKYTVDSRTISVHITKIRKKLKNIHLDNIIIQSKYKKGYVLINKAQ